MKAEKTTNKAVALIENLLFICCLILITLRVTFTEAPTTQPSQIQAAINDSVYSLSLSGALIFLFLIWVLVRLFSGRFTFRAAAFEIGILVLLAAAIVAGVYASNKRAAITSSITLIAPILLAFMLSGLLNSHIKIKILLIVIAALGVIACWQSSEQYFISNQIMLEEYKEDPNAIILPLGIQPGSFNQMLLEHRIMSKDVRASFTTSNSAGSFAILTCFAMIAILAERARQRKIFPLQGGDYVLALFVFAANCFSLFITRSKGAIAAFTGAMMIFAILILSRRSKLIKNIILTVVIIGVISVIFLVGWYGEKVGRLPGGNSMLVRWQYWRASAQMFYDHAMTGVGPGNFLSFYTQYKPASAIETVSDPHCFLLSIGTQYGVLGLLGFLIIAIVPLYRAKLTDMEGLEDGRGANFGRMAMLCGILIIAVMLVIRPYVVPASTAKTIDEIIYVVITEYIATPAAFLVGFGILVKSLQTIRKNEYATRNTGITEAALFCGLLGVLIHNLIDFAILEPGVLTTFCAGLGCLIAMDSQKSIPVASLVKVPAWVKALATTAVIIFCYAYLNYAVIPVAKSSADIEKAKRPSSLGKYNIAHSLLAEATDDDPLSPEAPLMNGRLYLQYIDTPAANREEALKQADIALFTAVDRNSQDYKNYEAIAEVFYQRAKLIPEQKDSWFNQALFFAARATELYPGNAELYFRLAQLEEETGQPEKSLKHYQKAVQIEDSYREQFKVMYPGREVFSRLPAEKYEMAKEEIKTLTRNPQKTN